MKAPCSLAMAPTSKRCVSIALTALAACADPPIVTPRELVEQAPAPTASGDSGELPRHGWSTGQFVDSWGEPTGVEYASVEIEHEVSQWARLAVDRNSVSIRFGTVRLDSCSGVGSSWDEPVCRLDVRLGDPITVFNVVERDGTVVPLPGEDGAPKLFQGLVLAGVTRDDAQVRVKLDFVGRGDVVFDFPLAGACEALASLGLIYTRECDSGQAAEPVVLAKWNHEWGKNRVQRWGAALTHHQPTELVSFWVLERYESRLDFDRRTEEWPWFPGHYWWTEVDAAGGEEHGSKRGVRPYVGGRWPEVRKRRFEPVGGTSNGTGDYIVVVENGTVRGRIDGEDYSNQASHLAPDLMGVGRTAAAAGSPDAG